MSDKFLDLLGDIGEANDSDISLVDAALAIAAIQGDVASIERYQNHIQKLCDQVKSRHEAFIKEGAQDNVATQIAALKDIIADKHEYSGDEETYDDLQNVDLIRVIERRKGMPVAIALIYIHVARAQGWQVKALSFPAHVVCRIEKEAERVLFDPFHKCKILEAHDLRQML